MFGTFLQASHKQIYVEFQQSFDSKPPVWQISSQVRLGNLHELGEQ